MTTDVSELRMNVAALKRVDPYVRDILETATHVALYTFNGEKNEWEKTDIEGALFVYSRIGEPYNSILIMNRLNTKNQVEPVTPGLDLQLQEPFLLYKNSKGNIYGIWFYDKDECVRISSMLNKLAKESDTSNKVTPKNKKTVPKKTNNVDIFSMLSKAQEDFKSNKSGGSEKPVRGINSKSPMSNAIGELSGAINAMNMAQDVTSKSVMDFFAKAKVNTGHFKAGDQPQTGNVVNEGKPLLARLMSHPAAHTLEHIEKQHRSITPQPAAPAQPQPGMIPMNNQSCDNSIITKLRNKMPSQSNANTASSAHMGGQEYSSAHGMPCSDMSSVLCADNSHSSSSFLRIQSPTANNSNNLVNQHKSNANVSNFVDAYESIHKPNDSVTGNAMSFDTLFQHSSTANVCDDLMGQPLTPKTAALTTSGSTPALIPPGMFAAPSPATAEPLHRPIEPLTRNQLLQAFNYLLRNDPEFVNKLHEAYVKSLGEILS
ncbi:mRNA-decapping enzyme 1A [Nasonia vitripennis]|uniref:mRNA-decapping enzyme C-terminal domain-containing protein n=1 Tax=Nasonia vitripennis TaxID=7425 RepID=A0A7M7QXZ6_NASVI|nr:mRNA-decapping enzyme 1A [Nasonia vitripennis]XP_032454394.1 mRNA-decapping enzyme 1A [Nasonia vitripennis]XP_032454395.1 mRNA-decapping enzyme 1A [Nasonia vitripennis]XP_032454396.1 mRNA-decapping enzyme 1A [Nasonia vitripennis]XP_032454397.1 mRNA-decapping enzyme 1A [Nasonia vitripennis]